jgi:hypothetical protein
MNYKLSACLLAFAALAACGGGGEDVAGDPGPGDWQILFDGSDLARWNEIGDANWRLVNDYVEADSGNGFLVSKEDYGDFELTLEFWVTLEANSGVFLRCQDPQQIGADNCYEVNIYDTRPDQTYRSGSIVDVSAPSAQVNTGGRWNAFRIVMQGARLQVELNGTQTVDVQDDRHASGPLALQYGAGTVIFRNVRLRTL